MPQARRHSEVGQHLQVVRGRRAHGALKCCISVTALLRARFCSGGVVPPILLLCVPLRCVLLGAEEASQPMRRLCQLRPARIRVRGVHWPNLPAKYPAKCVAVRFAASKKSGLCDAGQSDLGSLGPSCSDRKSALGLLSPFCSGRKSGLGPSWAAQFP